MRKLLFTLLLLFPSLAQAADYTALQVGGLVSRFLGEGSLNASTFPLDATTDAFGCSFCMPEDATITQACVLLGFKTGTPPTYIISLQTLSSTAVNSGTVLGGGTPASATFTVGSDGAFQCVTLANSIALVRGQCLALNVAHSSGTVNASNNEEFAYGMVSNGGGPKENNPLCWTNAAGTKTKQNTRIPVFAVKSASKTYGRPATGSQPFTVTGFSSDSTPDEYALRFMIPASTCSTYKVRAITCLGMMPATGKLIDTNLYSGTTSLQLGNDYDSDFTDHATATSDRWPMRFTFDDTTLDDLDCGTAYRIGFAPTASAANMGLAVLNVAANSDLTAYPGGVEWYLSTRTDAGAWTDTTTKRPICDLEIEDMTAPVGGGGSVIIQTNNNGGFQR